MARTYTHLWPHIVRWRSLLSAYHACRRRKRHQPPAIDFEFNWEHNLLALQRDLIDGTYRPGAYHHFYIFDPKKRKISAAPFRDRVVHHAVVRVLEPIYERRFIHDSYACRKGKGTHRAINRAQHFLQRYDYFLKTDVVSFFPCVDHEILLALLRRHIADDRLMALIALILESGEDIHAADRQPSWFAGDDLFAALRPKGLPRLLPQRVKRFSRRLRRQQREFAAATIGPDEIRSSLQVWLAAAAPANTHGLRRDLWRRVSFRRGTR